MGITGLIPFLEKSSRPVNISQYGGCTVAIDAYCWLHKGAFACAEKLARGDKTDVYVTYCMKYVNMLLSHNIKPILVFDGRHLPAKGQTEKKRRENREMNKRRAAELLRQDKPNEARSFLQRCIDVTHTMALQLMRECRSRNIDCITAPYEADAQLAYLNIHNIAHIVITEDSDLLLFGCTRVLFKLDLVGNGLLVEQDRLHLSMGMASGCFSLDKFRYMCILSGCDYLPSLPKIGLAKSCRFIKSTVDPDIHRALSRLGNHLNMVIQMPLDYRDKFMEADAMFRHQPVFDPLTRQLVPLTPLPAGTSPLPLLSKEPLSPQQLEELAFGNLDPFTLQKVDNWIPDQKCQKNGWSAKPVAPHKSIWEKDFKPKGLVIEQPKMEVKRQSTAGKVMERKLDLPTPHKRPLISADEELSAMRQQFGTSPHPVKKPCYNDEDILDLLDKSDKTPPKSEVANLELLESPKKTHPNLFIKDTPRSANKFSGLSKLAQFRRTSVSDTNIVQSRYFGSVSTNKTEVKPNNDMSPVNTLKDVSNVMEKSEVEHQKHSPFEVKHVEKLSDNNINSLIQEDMGEEDKETLSTSNGKENVSTDSLRTNQGNKFRWKPSLTDMFGFKSKTLASSPAVRSDFVKPLQDESKREFESSFSVTTTRPCEKENKTTPCRRNPFAKVAKIEHCSQDLNSQESSSGTDSQLDFLTPETVISEVRKVSPVMKTTPRPQVKVGLSKKQTSGNQKTLLTMFAFTPKAKLQK